MNKTGFDNVTFQSTELLFKKIPYSFSQKVECFPSSGSWAVLAGYGLSEVYQSTINFHEVQTS